MLPYHLAAILMAIMFLLGFIAGAEIMARVRDKQ
jgi:hypothetical protein